MMPVIKSVTVLDLLLNRDNPRHVHKESQEAVIAYLLADEQVFNLAKHISRYGFNPLEITALFPDEAGNMVVAEGNRRICAAQLLNDPQKAPEKDRKRFKALSEKSRDVSKVNAAIFDDYETAQPWLQILHDGEQDGVGRRNWKPDQKARATTRKSKDALTVSLLDHAVEAGILDDETRSKVRVSTVTRYLANPKVREAMGITSPATSEEIQVATDNERFSKAVRDLVDGVVTGDLHSRSKSDDWHKFAEKIVSTHGQVPKGQKPRPLGSVVSSERSKVVSQGKTARARLAYPETKQISRSPSITSALNELQSYKLTSLYKSLTSLSLVDHPALLTVGSWVFIEALTALHGRREKVEFVGYIGGCYDRWGYDNAQKRDSRVSLEYIQSHGNAEKHSGLLSSVDARNLSVQFKVIEDVLMRLISESKSKQGGVA